MNRFWYSVILYCLSPLLLIYFVVRAIKHADYRSRWAERFGLTRLRQTDLLIHTASMGETLAALPLIKHIMKTYPTMTITMTSTSPTGSAEIVKAFGDQVQHVYLPVDIAWCVKRFLRQVAPKYLLILETELWPNLLHFAKSQQAKVMLANARMSAKSAQNYQKWPKLTAQIMTDLDMVAVQTENEKQRLVTLGVSPESIAVTGSLKFDVNIDASLKEKGLTLRAEWHKSQVPVWVAGSVHPGEFAEILIAHQQVLAVYPDSLLILVPRHPEKFDEAANAITQSGLSMTRRSQMEGIDPSIQVLLGDTMGELLLFYTMADQAFVGGSLIEHGGQNPLEAAALGLGLIMGHSRYNFTDICSQLSKTGAMQECDDGHELGQQLLQGIEYPLELQSRQQHASDFVMANRGATDKQFNLLQERLISQ